MVTLATILSGVLLFVLGALIGAGVVFWLFGRDDTVVRLRSGEVIVREDVLEKLVVRAKARMGGHDKENKNANQVDDDESE